jgi:cell division protein FtsQ
VIGGGRLWSLWSGRRVSNWAKALSVVIAVCLVVWVVGFSTVLGVRTVRVSGTNLLTSDQVLQVASISTGRPLFRLNTGAIEDRVSRLPEVRSVRVSTSYPSAVIIAVTERVAVGYRVLARGASLVDVDNNTFRDVSHVPSRLPKLQTSGGEVPDAARNSAQAVVAAALPGTVARTVALIVAPTPESVILTLTDGRTVLWGGTDRGAEKARLLPILLKQRGTYFDLSDPDSVISREGTGGG